jgi:hypothetical protein
MNWWRSQGRGGRSSGAEVVAASDGGGAMNQRRPTDAAGADCSRREVHMAALPNFCMHMCFLHLASSPPRFPRAVSRTEASTGEDRSAGRAMRGR